MGRGFRFNTSNKFRSDFDKIAGGDFFSNAFDKGLDSIPSPNSNRMIFPWSKSRKDFIIRGNFNNGMAEGRITQNEVERAKDRIRSEVKNYKIHSHTILLCLGACCAGFFLGVLATYVFINSEGTAFIMFYFFWILGCYLGCFLRKRWGDQMRKRGRDIQRLMVNLNREYSARGIEWNSGNLGTYLELKIIGEGGGERQGFGNNFFSRPAPMTNSPGYGLGNLRGGGFQAKLGGNENRITNHGGGLNEQNLQSGNQPQIELTPPPLPYEPDQLGGRKHNYYPSNDIQIE